MGKRTPKTSQPGQGPQDEHSRTEVDTAKPPRPADARTVNNGHGSEAAAPPTGPNRAGEEPTNGRRVAIDSLAAKLGKSWAQRSREELHREGRAAAGGWPGTVGEATAYVAQALLSGQHRLPQPLLTTLERELLARGVYASARKEWLGHLDPESTK